MSETITEKEIDELIKEVNSRNLVLYNDNVNTFELVIFCLMKYCEHELNQAEQCSLIVHNKGKCKIKCGTFDDLKPIYDALTQHELTVEIE
jgi:ATP-dependent Clp protease adaptor protein ClpS